ncbi:MAG: SBBP repeat-containing protein [Bryobacteraceae bacterium]
MFRPLAIVLFVSAASALGAAGRPAAHNASPATAQAALARMPLRFEANQGQFDPAVRYVARAGNYTLLLTANGPVFSIPGSAHAGISLANSNPQAVIEPLDPLAGRTDYFLGHRENWHTGVKNYAKVRYRSVYPGVDLVYYGSRNLLEYDFVLQPGADPAAIAMKFDGPAHVSLSPEGDLVLETAGRKLVQHKPYVYQEDPSGARREVSGAYRLMADGAVKLRLGRYDHSKPLVVDPAIEYCTYLGGPGTDRVNAAKLLPSSFSIALPSGLETGGLLYLAGQTDTGQIPYINGAYNNDYDAGIDNFIQILDTTPSGGFQPVYSSYIGGSGDDVPLGLDVDANGIFYVTGSTTSTDFPMAGNSYQTTGGATNQSCYVYQLNPALYGGISLLYSSYLSGTTGNDSATGIAVDANQNMYMVGTALSSDFPVTVSAYQSALWGDSDVFIAEMNPNSGALLYSSYIGGEDDDYGANILLGPNNLVYFSASTFSTEFAMAGYQYSASPFGGEDVIVGIMDLTQSGLNCLVYATYFGGSKNDAVLGMAFDPNGNVIITGYTISPNFPVTPDAVQHTYGGDTDAWVAVLNPNLPFTQGLLYSSYLGGSSGDTGTSVTSDDAGNIYVAGYTLSPNFPVTNNALQGTWPGGVDLFITEIRRGVSGLNGIVFSTYMGGAANYFPASIAVGADGTMFVTGYGNIGLPTSPASAQGGYAGGVSDGFVLVIGDPPPAGTAAGVPVAKRSVFRQKGGPQPHQ